MTDSTSWQWLRALADNDWQYWKWLTGLTDNYWQYWQCLTVLTMTDSTDSLVVVPQSCSKRCAFRLESRDDSLETLLMYMPKTERCRTSEVKYMEGSHRVSNKNQPHISSIKFLKSRVFFIVVRRLHLSKALWNCLPRLHHLSKGCLKKIRLVKLFLRVF